VNPTGTLPAKGSGVSGGGSSSRLDKEVDARGQASPELDADIRQFLFTCVRRSDSAEPSAFSIAPLMYHTTKKTVFQEFARFFYNFLSVNIGNSLANGQILFNIIHFAG
jgi:hypothetical protein